MKAYAWATGRIDFGRKVPEGALQIAAGPAKTLRAEISATARHGYGQSAGILLVPGVPESGGGDAAVDALSTYIREIKKRTDWHARNYGTLRAAAAKMEKIVQAYLRDYEFDDGESCHHIPTATEAILIEDAVHGLLADDYFLDALTDWRLRARALKPEEKSEKGGYYLVTVKYANGTYTTSTVGGERASCTSSDKEAVERLGKKLYGDKATPRIEQVGSHWRIYYPEAN